MKGDTYTWSYYLFRVEWGPRGYRSSRLREFEQRSWEKPFAKRPLRVALNNWLKDINENICEHFSANDRASRTELACGFFVKVLSSTHIFALETLTLLYRFFYFWEIFALDFTQSWPDKLRFLRQFSMPSLYVFLSSSQPLHQCDSQLALSKVVV